MTSVREIRQKAHQVQRGYAGDADRPLAGYVGAMGAYGAFVGGLRYGEGMLWYGRAQ